MIPKQMRLKMLDKKVPNFGEKDRYNLLIYFLKISDCQMKDAIYVYRERYIYVSHSTALIQSSDRSI